MEAVLVSMRGELQPQKDLRTGWPGVLSGGYLTGDARGARAGRIGREPECLRSNCPPFWSVVEFSASHLQSEKETGVRELLRGLSEGKKISTKQVVYTSRNERGVRNARRNERPLAMDRDGLHRGGYQVQGQPGKKQAS